MKQYVFFVNGTRFSLTHKQLMSSGLNMKQIILVKRVMRQGGEIHFNQ
jgi:hypothetical protein